MCFDDSGISTAVAPAHGMVLEFQIFFGLRLHIHNVMYYTRHSPSGCSSAWLEHLLWEQGVARSNRVTPTI